MAHFESSVSLLLVILEGAGAVELLRGPPGRLAGTVAMPFMALVIACAILIALRVMFDRLQERKVIATGVETLIAGSGLA